MITRFSWKSWIGFLRKAVSIGFCLLALIAAAGCANQGRTPPRAQPPETLSVFAAASLTGAFGELASDYQASHPGARVEFNFAGSQQLANQIREGAPADVFASASPAQMDAAIRAGKVSAGSERNFAGNRLVIACALDSAGRITRIQDLAGSGLRVVLAAKEVPAGQYALEFLAKAAQDPQYGPEFQAGVLKNVVSYEDNVKAVLNKVVLGEADAGIVYTSDLNGDVGSRVKQIDIPDNLNVTAAYSIAVIHGAAHPDAAGAFVRLVLSEEGQAVLARYGFEPVP